MNEYFFRSSPVMSLRKAWPHVLGLMSALRASNMWNDGKHLNIYLVFIVCLIESTNSFVQTIPDWVVAQELRLDFIDIE